MRTYRMKMNESGTNYVENEDPSLLQNMRTTAGMTKEDWPIVPLEVKFRVNNDPELREFDDLGQAQELRDQLQQETFDVAFTKNIITPPPADFVDE